MDSVNADLAASPKKGSPLLQRVASALVMMPLVIGFVWWHYWSVVVVVILAAVVALIELYGAFVQSGFRPRVWVGIISAILLVLSAVLQPLDLAVDPLSATLALIIVGSLVAELPRHADKTALASWALTIAGALYIGWLLTFVIALRGLETPLQQGLLVPLGLQPGAAWVYLMFGITWAQDSAAYFVGRTWGRRQMAPVLSPKKTWEGAAGGLAAATLAGVAAVPLFGLPIPLGVGALFGFVGGIVGPIGDLAESLIKRQLGLKDVGHLIPGHGGLLDRADSLLFTAPALYYLVAILIDR